MAAWGLTADEQRFLRDGAGAEEAGPAIRERLSVRAEALDRALGPRGHGGVEREEDEARGRALVAAVRAQAAARDVLDEHVRAGIRAELRGETPPPDRTAEREVEFATAVLGAATAARRAHVEWAVARSTGQSAEERAIAERMALRALRAEWEAIAAPGERYTLLLPRRRQSEDAAREAGRAADAATAALAAAGDAMTAALIVAADTAVLARAGAPGRGGVRGARAGSVPGNDPRRGATPERPRRSGDGCGGERARVADRVGGRISATGSGTRNAGVGPGKRTDEAGGRGTRRRRGRGRVQGWPWGRTSTT